jgi:hypothetical protein
MIRGTNTRESEMKNRGHEFGGEQMGFSAPQIMLPNTNMNKIAANVLLGMACWFIEVNGHGRLRSLCILGFVVFDIRPCQNVWVSYPILSCLVPCLRCSCRDGAVLNFPFRLLFLSLFSDRFIVSSVSILSRRNFQSPDPVSEVDHKSRSHTLLKKHQPGHLLFRHLGHGRCIMRP